MTNPNESGQSTEPAPDELGRPAIRALRHSLHLIRSNPLAIFGFAIVASFFVMAIFAPYIAPPNPILGNPHNPYILPATFAGNPSPPSHEFLFGTGPDGTDIFYGVIWGSRISLMIAFTVVGITAVVGILLGAFAGYFGGAVENAIMRVTDAFLALPPILLAMAIASIYGGNITNLTLILVFVWWPRYARLVRGQVLAVKEKTFVDSARAIGDSDLRILGRHVLPNSISPVLVLATLDLGNVILVAAGLSFLGLGAQPFTTEWGLMVSMGQQWILAGDWWVSVFPGLAIFFFVMGWNLVGDSLRDVFDPRLSKL